MTITSADLMLFAAAQQTDDAYGGGKMTGDVIQDGVDNDLFPAIDVGAWSSGRVQLRKAYAAVVSDNDDLAAGATINMKTDTGDTDVHQVAFAFGIDKTERSAAIAYLQKFPYKVSPYWYQTGWQYVSTSSVLAFADIPVGTLLVFFGGSFAPDKDPNAYLANAQFVGHVVSKTGSSSPWTLTLSPSGIASGLLGSTLGVFFPLVQNPAAPACVGIATLTGTSSGATVALDRVTANIVPQSTPYPLAANGIDPTPLRLIRGQIPIFRPGDTVIVRQGGTSERATVLTVNYNGGLVFTANLANSYTAGATVSALANLGDMQATAGPSFSQQTWTKTFADSIIGSAISANYDRTAGDILVTNFGAEPDRYAIVFTSTTAFKLFTEKLGQIATGVVGSDFSPNNPITGEPLFTIEAAGWGSGWAIGNVLRFNTTGARIPFWNARCVSPSSPGSAGTPTLEFCVSV